jgi:hypothetical protein
VTRVATSSSALAQALLTAASAFPMPPAAGQMAVFPASWNALPAMQGPSAPDTVEVTLWAVGALGLTAATYYEAIPQPLLPAFTEFAFTTTHSSSDTNLTATAHGMQTGDGPVLLSNSGGALPAGLSASTPYWLIKVDANTLQLATSLALALAGTAVTFSADGTGTQDISPDGTERLYWCAMALLGPPGQATPGTVTLTAEEACWNACPHSPQAVAGAIVATVGSGSATASASVQPRTPPY